MPPAILTTSCNNGNTFTYGVPVIQFAARALQLQDQLRGCCFVNVKAPDVAVEMDFRAVDAVVPQDADYDSDASSDSEIDSETEIG